MGPTWVLSAPGGPHVGPIILVIRVMFNLEQAYTFSITTTQCRNTSWHGNVFRTTSPFLTEFPSQIPNYYIFSVVSRNKLLNNSRIGGDLRHNDASVTSLWWVFVSKLVKLLHAVYNMKYFSGVSIAHYTVHLAHTTWRQNTIPFPC